MTKAKSIKTPPASEADVKPKKERPKRFHGLVAKNIRVSEETWLAAIVLGDGSASNGIRIAVAEASKSRLNGVAPEIAEAAQKASTRLRPPPKRVRSSNRTPKEV